MQSVDLSFVWFEPQFRNWTLEIATFPLFNRELIIFNYQTFDRLPKQICDVNLLAILGILNVLCRVSNKTNIFPISYKVYWIDLEIKRPQNNRNLTLAGISESIRNSTMFHVSNDSFWQSTGNWYGINTSSKTTCKEIPKSNQCFVYL